MASTVSIADYFVVGIMLVIPAGIGVYFRFTGGRQRTTFEFLMADKSMSILPVSFSIMATGLSAISLLGAPAETYLYGTQIVARELTFAIVTVMVAYYILPIYFELNVNSIFTYLERRFGKVTEIITSILFSIQMILYMSVVMYAPSLALSTITGLSVWASVISMSLVCTFYSTLGGLKAVLWTDLVQGFMMIVTVYLLIVKGSMDFGGFYKVYEVADRGQRLELFNTSTDFTIRYTLWNSFAVGIVIGLFQSGANFSIVQRLLSCGDVKKAQRSLLWSIPLSFICQIGTYVLGIVMYSYYNECDPFENKEVKSGDQIALLFIMRLFQHLPGMPGLCVAGIFSGALSTMSSIINALAATTLEDYMKPFTKCNRLKGSTITFIVKFLAASYGGLCLFLTFAIASVKGLYESATLLYGIIAGPTLGVFCLGMFTSTANEIGILMGLITGFAITSWGAFGTIYNGYRYPPLPLSTAGCTLNISTPFLEMYKVNSTWNIDAANSTSYLPLPKAEERYIFPLYKISYMWVPAIGFISTMIVGYLASYIKTLFKKNTELDVQLLSPFVKHWFQKSSTRKKENEYIKLPQAIKKMPMDTELNTVC